MKNLIFIFLLFSANGGFSQQINAEIGRLSTEFIYKNSKGEKLTNLYPGVNVCYEVGFRQTLSNKLFFHTNAIYNTYSSSGSDTTFNNSFSWEANYLGFNLGLDFDALMYKNFRLNVQAEVSPQFLTSGVQSINDQLFKLKGVEQFNSPFVFYRGGLRLNYCVQPNLAISLKYMYGVGNSIGGGNDNERLSYITQTITLGTIWSLNNCEYCFRNRYRQKGL